jgi:hypothetical protein
VESGSPREGLPCASTVASDPSSRAAGRSAFVALLTVAALAGCGGGEDTRKDTAQTAKTASATPVPTPSPAPGRAEDHRIAEASQLKLEDFPAGWEESDTNQSEAADCEAISSARDKRTARAASSQFGRGENTVAQSTVYLFSDDATAQDQYAALTSKGTRTCIGKDLVKRLQKANSNLQVGEPRTTRVSVDPLGDQHDGGRVTLPVTTGGQEVELFTDFVFVRESRGIALMLFVDALSPFDEDLRADLTSKVSRRLASELG